ncbi:MAG TPA: NADP-dependent oxidoreductase [Lacisediminihabitans sp.]|nr:NADP-dependent oxidoreductase [Lacisediminihabitans sp.]HXD62929.1 NADP-dependent oxidoreductase [Lacisediminihabitans sp.]
MTEAHTTQTVKRWVARAFGGLDVLEFETAELPMPAAGEITVEVRAAGMNPADFKHIRTGDASSLPVPIGYEIAGIVTAVGPNVEPRSVAVGDEVLAFRIRGGYASSVTIPAKDAFPKPPSLGFAEAANLLLAATTAADMLRVTGVQAGEAVLVHGASGAVGVSVVQQAALLGARVIGTASEKNFELLERFGAEPVGYGEGLEQRVRSLAPDGVDVALDTVGTDEAIDVSFALLRDASRIVTTAAQHRARESGLKLVSGPESTAYRDSVRSRLIELAANGRLVVPVARTFPLSDALEALRLLEGGHPGGKLALIP